MGSDTRRVRDARDQCLVTACGRHCLKSESLVSVAYVDHRKVPPGPSVLKRDGRERSDCSRKQKFVER
jgi:hypothetical protein